MWGRRIIKAQERVWFSEKDRHLSAKWDCCACGELDADIPRYESGVPIDEVLADEGNGFFLLAQENKFQLAAECLVRIQKRAVEVIQDNNVGAKDVI